VPTSYDKHAKYNEGNIVKNKGNKNNVNTEDQYNYS